MPDENTQQETISQDNQTQDTTVTQDEQQTQSQETQTTDTSQQQVTQDEEIFNPEEELRKRYTLDEIEAIESEREELRAKLEKLEKSQTQPKSDEEKLSAIDELLGKYDPTDPQVLFLRNLSKAILSEVKKDIPKFAEEKITEYSRKQSEENGSRQWESKMSELHKNEKTEYFDEMEVTRQFTQLAPKMKDVSPEDLLYKLARSSHIKNEKKFAERLKNKNKQRIDNANERKKISGEGGTSSIGTLQPTDVKDFNKLGDVINQMASANK